MATIGSIILFTGISFAQTPDWEAEFPGYNRSVPKRLRRPPSGFGTGIFVGPPTGPVALDLAYKWEKRTLQGSLGGSWFDANVTMRLDYLWLIHSIPSDEYLHFPIMLGVGVSGKINERDPFGSASSSQFLGNGVFGSNYFGIRVPLAMTTRNENISMEIYSEVAPVLQVYPDLGVGFEFGIGSRLYFF